MINKLTLTNYRSHELTVLSLGQLTLLVGDNGVGKTSVLRSVMDVANLVGRTDDSILSADSTRSRSAGVTLALDGVSGPDETKWSVRVDGRDNQRPEMRFEWDGKAIKAGMPHIPASRAVPPEGILTEIGNARVLALQPHLLSRPSTSDDLVPSISSTGNGLATCLQYLKLTQSSRFDEFQEMVRNVVPNLEEVGFGRVRLEAPREHASEKVRHYIADELRFRFLGTDSLPARSGSEGTLIAVGLLAFLHMPSCPRVVLLDDIDRGLHPRAQRELILAIRRILRHRPDLQFIATSHSPYLVDSFSREEVVVLSREAATGRVIARHLSEHPDHRLVKTLTTGEFLNSSGKDWFGL